ncbi:hypothetical protein V8E55_001035 [Tylopilus felleus]
MTTAPLARWGASEVVYLAVIKPGRQKNLSVLSFLLPTIVAPLNPVSSSLTVMIVSPESLMCLFLLQLSSLLVPVSLVFLFLVRVEVPTIVPPLGFGLSFCLSFLLCFFSSFSFLLSLSLSAKMKKTKKIRKLR